MSSVRSLALAVVAVACSTVGVAETTPPEEATPATTVSTVVRSSSTPTTSSTTTSTSTVPTPSTTTTTLPPGVTPPPEWLGTRPLPLDEAGNPVVPPTPEVLVDRRFTSPDVLPPPASGEFEATIGPLSAEVASRSTWKEGCPVGKEDLSYLTLAFWGFDQQPHTGEMIVNTEVAEDIVGVFEALFDARFPIEQMRIATPADLEADATGDGNVTESFVCRPATGSTSVWSQHAFGLAIDINPFHNPYLRGDVLIPELASSYLDRDQVRPGMIVEGDVVTTAFDRLGWGWGGRWNSLDDWQHFSQSGS